VRLGKGHPSTRSIHEKRKYQTGDHFEEDKRPASRKKKPQIFGSGCQDLGAKSKEGGKCLPAKGKATWLLKKPLKGWEGSSCRAKKKKAPPSWQ